MINILLDMDGVIANFFKQACLYHGRSYMPEEITNYNISEIWGLTNDEFWAPLTGYDFWAGIEPYDYAHEMFEKLKAIAPVTICTAPSYDHNCIAGKLNWLDKHLGVKLNDVVFASKKYLLADEGTILIDDHSEKVRMFSGCGGVGILFPQPWNHGEGGWELIIEKTALEIMQKTEKLTCDRRRLLRKSKLTRIELDRINRIQYILHNPKTDKQIMDEGKRILGLAKNAK